MLLAYLSMQKSKHGADLSRKFLNFQHFGAMSIALIVQYTLRNQSALKLPIAPYKKRSPS
jgi:hypothetical protein